MVELSDCGSPPPSERSAKSVGACAPDGNSSAASQCSSDWGASGFECKSSACVRDFPAEAGTLRQVPGAAAPVLRRKEMTAAQFSQLLGEAIQAGSQGARQLQGLQAMKLALSNRSNGFLRDGGYSRYFADHFMLPLTGAVWSSSPATIRDFPARRMS